MDESSKSNKVTNGKDGFSMEDFPTESTKSATAEDGFNLIGSGTSSSSSEPDLKKTQNGDWSSEEVDTRNKK